MTLSIEVLNAFLAILCLKTECAARLWKSRHFCMNLNCQKIPSFKKSHSKFCVME